MDLILSNILENTNKNFNIPDYGCRKMIRIGFKGNFCYIEFSGDLWCCWDKKNITKKSKIYDCNGENYLKIPNTVMWCDQQEWEKKLEEYGPDILHSPSPKMLKSRIIEHPNRKLISLLLKPEIIGNVNNVVISETMYRCKFHPSILVSKVGYQEWTKFHHHLSATAKNYHYKSNSTMKEYLIYRRKNCPKNHSASVMRIHRNAIFWCSKCQKI